MAYAELAAGVRHFVTHVMGPSLDVLGTSIELLKHEGLVTPISGEKDKAVLEITNEGLAELKVLLKARIKTAENDLNKLVIALKFRFMDLLNADERLLQLDLLSDSVENELARLEDLRAFHAEDSVHLVECWIVKSKTSNAALIGSMQSASGFKPPEFPRRYNRQSS